MPSGERNYSAIIVASDATCGGCDLNSGRGRTPDSDAINARADDIAEFFNAGGGILALAGSDNRDVYYDFLPIPATGVAVSAPFTVTSLGESLGITQADANCCPTHNSFELPEANSVLEVAEFDNAGFAETLVAANAIIVGGERSTTLISYDEAFSQPTSQEDGQGRKMMYDIDPTNGNRMVERRVIGEADDTTNAEMDDLVTTYTYTTHGLIDTITDPLGRVTDYDYNARGLMMSVTYALGTADEATMTYDYDLAGNRILMIDGEGNRTTYDYDELNRLEQTTEQDPDGDAGPLTSPVTTITYDEAGNVKTATDSNDNTTTNEYDELDRLIQVTSPDPDREGPLPAPITIYAYDPAGNMETMTDPNGHTTSYTYDGRNRRVTMTDPDGGVTRFGYDSDNNLVRVVDPVDNVTRFIYDARNRLVLETDPFGKHITYDYDASNNLVRKIDRNERVTRYTYDDVNRLRTEEWLAEDESVLNTITYTYDDASNLKTLVDNQSALVFTYDARNRVKTVDNAGTPDAPNVILTYAYDDVGNVLSVTDTIDGNPGATTGYDYDGLNRLVSLNQSGTDTSDKRVDFTYNALGQYTAIDRYSDLAGTQLVIGTEYTYDDQNRLTRLDHQNSASESVAFYDYVYDVESRITRITDVDGVTDYTYDDRDQLATADYSDASRQDEFYQYDANGKPHRVQSARHRLPDRRRQPPALRRHVQLRVRQRRQHDPPHSDQRHRTRRQHRPRVHLGSPQPLGFSR